MHLNRGFVKNTKRRAKRLWGRDTHWLEGAIGLYLVGRGIVWMHPEAVMSPEIYGSMVDIAAPYGWGLACLTIGLVIFYGIFVNGDYKWMPRVRAGVLMAALTIHVMMFAALAQTETWGGFQAAIRSLISIALTAWGMLNVAVKARA